MRDTLVTVFWYWEILNKFWIISLSNWKFYIVSLKKDIGFFFSPLSQIIMILYSEFWNGKMQRLNDMQKN